ncbi:MAG: type VI secretion system baseplate subunit TssG [Ramlibacter sp.]
MRIPQRRFEPAVIERLFLEPYRFEYCQAVRLLELWLKRQGVREDGLVTGYMRFRNSLSLGFPASELAAVETEPPELEPTAGALGAAARSGTLKYVRPTPTVLGFPSSSGVLPAHYTERLAEHLLYQRDDGPRAFLDTFSNRSLAMFYEAWRKYRLEFKYQLDGRDRFLPLLLSLGGLGNASLRGRLAGEGQGIVRDESLGYFAAALRHRPASAAQLGKLLGEYFGRTVSVEQFIGAWYPVPQAQQTTLGRPDATLGIGAMAGARVWQRDLRMRLVVGPLDHEGFTAFLPGGLAARALRSLLSMFTGVTLEYEVEVILRASDVHSVVLGENSRARLGWDAFLVDGPQAQDRRDVRYLLPEA